ncbi:PAS domain-containing hybrid sensor histidine kinase/response regulator [Caldithrix abyssi]
MAFRFIEGENRLLKILIERAGEDDSIRSALLILNSMPGVAGSYAYIKCLKTNFEFTEGEPPPELEVEAMHIPLQSLKIIKRTSRPEQPDETLSLIPLARDYLVGVLAITHNDSFTAYLKQNWPLLKIVFEKLGVALFVRKIGFCLDQKIFERLSRVTQELLIVLDRNGIVQYVNEAVLKLSSYSREQINGKHISLFFPKDHVAHILKPFHKALKNKSSYFYHESTFITADGQTIPVELVALSFEEHPESEHIILVARNISEKKQLLKQLQTQNQNLQTTLKSIGDVVITTDRELIVTFLNERALQIWGKNAVSRIGKPITDLFVSKKTPAKAEKIKNLIKEVLQSNEIKLLEEILEIGTEENEYRFIVQSIAPIKDSNSAEALGAVIVMHDVTELYALQKELDYRRQQLDNLMNNLPLVIYQGLNDKNLTMKFLSKGIYDLTGYSPEELLDNHKVKYADLIVPEDLKRKLSEVRRALKSNRPFQSVYRIITRSGEIKWVWEQGRKVRYEKGGFLIEGFLADITEKQQAQEQIAHLNRILFVIRNINQLIVREKDEASLLLKSCRYIAESGDFNFAWIVKLDESSNIDLIYTDKNQPLPLIKNLIKEWIDRTIQNQQIIQFFKSDLPINGCRNFVVSLLKYEEQIFGSLVVGLKPGLTLSDEETDLFIEMTTDIAYALHVNQLEKQAQIVRSSIEVINKKLEGKTSAEILESLVKNMASVLNTEYVVIGKIDANNHDVINTLMVYEHGKIAENFSYALKGSPSEQILKKGTHSFKKDVCKYFPDDVLLNQWGANGYLGTPIVSSDGKKLGVFLAFSRDEIALASKLQHILEFFAGRIGLEMQRMEAEERLKQSEIKYRNIFENTPFGIYQTSPDGRVLEANPALLNMLGFDSLEELQKRDINKEGYPESNGRKKFLEKILNTRGYIVHEDVWLKKDGSPLFVREKARAVRDEQGNVLYFEGTVEDISDRKAKEEEILYQSQLIAAAQDPIIAIDLEYRITYWNKSAEHFYGYKEEDVKGKKIADILHINLPIKKLLRIKNEVLKNGFWRGEVGIFKKTKELAHVDMSLSLLYDSEGEPRAIVGIHRDISETVKYREAIKASEESYRGLYNAVQEAIYIQNPDGTFLDVNDGAVKMYGYPRSYFVGKTPVDLSAPEKNDMSMVLKKFKKALQGEPQIFEFWGRRANGEIFPKIVRLYKSKYFGKDVVIALALDVTEQKRAEEELRKLSAAVEQSPDSIVITDVNGIIEYVNPKLCEVTGYSREELMGKTPAVFKSGQHPQAIYEELWKTIKSGKIWKGELQNKRKDGSLFWESVIISPLFNEKGEITQFLGLKQDITAQKELEEEKKRLEKHLQQKQRLETIGTLAGGIAHDFNNILTPILGYAEMIKMAHAQDQKLKGQVEQIIKASLRARDLIQQILMFSRQLDDEPKPILLQNIVNEAYHLLRASIPRTIELIRKIDKNCKPVLGDPAKLHQVFMNLCTNAYQAMETTGGTLTIELKSVIPDEEMINRYPSLSSKPYVCLTVSDTGIGMDAPTMERIFEPFFTTKEVGRGTGLGLSVVHGIVKNYGGEIIVESRKGVGTTFHVFLPAADLPEKEEANQNAEIPTGHEKILLVDDESMVLDLQKNILEYLGYEVESFSDPLQALKCFEEDGKRFNLLITDLTMPHLTGIELAQKIRQLDDSLPIILLTGYSEELTPTLKEKYGIKEVLMKPVSAAQLAQAVRSVL